MCSYASAYKMCADAFQSVSAGRLDRAVMAHALAGYRDQLVWERDLVLPEQTG